MARLSPPSHDRPTSPAKTQPAPVQVHRRPPSTTTWAAGSGEAASAVAAATAKVFGAAAGLGRAAAGRGAGAGADAGVAGAGVGAAGVGAVSANAGNGFALVRGCDILVRGVALSSSRTLHLTAGDASAILSLGDASCPAVILASAESTTLVDITRPHPSVGTAVPSPRTETSCTRPASPVANIRLVMWE